MFTTSTTSAPCLKSIAIIRILFCLLVGLVGTGQEAMGQAPTLTVGFGYGDKSLIRSVASDAEGNVYVTGNFYSTTIDFDPGAGTASFTADKSDIFIAKYTAAGALVWVDVVSISDGMQDGGIGSSIAVDASNNVYITGYFTGTADFDPGVNTVNRISNPNGDIYVAKYNATGQFQWVNNVGGSNAYSRGNALTLDVAGNVYVTGVFGGTADFDPSAGNAIRTCIGSGDIFLVKYDTNGNFVWVNALEGSGNNDNGTAIATDPANNVYITGRFDAAVDFDPSPGIASRTSLGSDDIFLAKYDAQGNLRYVTAVGGTAFDFPLGIDVNAEGSAFVTGYFKGTADFDPSANVASRSSAGEEDIFVARYDAEGNFVWVNQIGATGFDVGLGVAVDDANNAYVVGRFSMTVDFDPGSGTASLTAINTGAPATGSFLAKYNAQGDYVWAKPVGSNGSGSVGAIALGATGNFFIGGTFTFSGNINFDPNTTNVIGGVVANYNADVIAITVTNVSTVSPPGGSPFNVGADLFVTYKRTGTFLTGNVFTAQLSDAMGRFDSPTIIGTLPVTTGGTITAKLPLTLSPSSRYRIRIVGSNPVAVGQDNGLDLTINSPLSLSASNLSLNGSGSLALSAANCPAVLTGLGWGKTFAFTGPPSGYLFSNVFRNFILQGNIAASNIRVPGVYTLTVSGNPDQTPVVYTISITGQGCP